ncbi:hypothetical protein AGOR_G00240070 [Albula goreensis]|uniref:Ig-like domain-containing protein n=1 Tax=Albula goreensis TaxID=1534307 RepID=A0A8T3CFZ6_9TELE|nr:hypothetical protein AGOR_G00240070 [Albula goreensis]
MQRESEWRTYCLVAVLSQCFLLTAYMMLCLFLLFSTMVGNSFQNGITAETSAKTAMEGDNVTLLCNYSSSSLTGGSLHWYRQYAGSRPEFLILILRNAGANKSEAQFTVKHDKEKTNVQLEIFPVKVADTALYYCALQPTVMGNLVTLYKNLTPSETIH